MPPRPDMVGRFWVVLAVGAMLAACGQRAPAAYPAAYEANFMRACEAQNPAPGICGCTWARIEASITPEDFAAVERMSPLERSASPVIAQIEGFRLACVGEAQASEPVAAPSP